MTVIDNSPGPLNVSIRRNDGSEEVVQVTAMPWVYRQQLCLDVMEVDGTTALTYIPLSNVKSWGVVA